jgi:hypothetical protein
MLCNEPHHHDTFQAGKNNDVHQMLTLNDKGQEYQDQTRQ